MRLTYLSIVVLFVLVGCAGGEETPATSATALVAQPATPTPMTVTATTAAATPEEEAPSTPTGEAQSGVRGVVSAYSDVATQPDEPLAEQTVVLLPLETAGAVLRSSTSPDDLRFLRTSLPEPRSEIVLAVTDDAGRYRATLPPDEYVLCLADSAGPSPTDYPLAVRGCGAFMVPPGTVVEINVSSGFGEILLEAG